MTCSTCRGGKGRPARQPVTRIVPLRTSEPSSARPVLGSYDESRTKIRDRIMGLRRESGKDGKDGR
jgi:hypothetical protein